MNGRQFLAPFLLMWLAVFALGVALSACLSSIGEQSELQSLRTRIEKIESEMARKAVQLPER